MASGRNVQGTFGKHGDLPILQPSSAGLDDVRQRQDRTAFGTVDEPDLEEREGKKKRRKKKKREEEEGRRGGKKKRREEEEREEEEEGRRKEESTEK